MTRRVSVLACLAGLLLSLPLAAEPRADEARIATLLERMAESLRALNYEGTLVYLHDNQLETLHLIHGVEDGQVRERLVSLSGPVRALSREPGRVTCVLPDGHPISVEHSGGASLLDAQGIVPERLHAHYRVALLGASRVAGRDTAVVGIVPRDDLRYGYRFHIDHESALPLKSDLIDQTGHALEQLMFTNLILHSGDGSQPQQADPAVRAAPRAKVEHVTRTAWRFETLPAGFELVMRHELDHPDGGNVEHFLFTDRLSAFSIYIEPDTRDGLEGASHIGAIHAEGRRIDGYQVTAVGEVPAKTVRAALAGVHRVKERQP